MSGARELKRNFWISLVSVVGAFALWEAGSRSGLLNPMFFPAPSSIARRLYELAFEEGFWSHLRHSAARLALGALIAIPPAITLAFAAELSPIAGRVINPWIAMTYPIPKLAVFPILLTIFGIGESPKVAIIAIGVFFLVFLATAQGTRRIVESGYLDVARVYRIPGSRSLRRVIFRGALPEILGGIKAGMGYGLVMVIAGEFTMSNQGLGVMMWNAWDQFRIVDVYCGLAVLSALGLVLFFGIDLAVHRLTKRLKGAA